MRNLFGLFLCVLAPSLVAATSWRRVGATETFRRNFPADRRIVILGVGTVNPLGNSVNEFWPKFASGAPAFGKVPFKVPNDFPSVAARVPLEDIKEGRRLCAELLARVSVDAQLRDLTRQSYFALRAAVEASSQANLLIRSPQGWKLKPELQGHVDVLIGSTLGGLIDNPDEDEIDPKYLLTILPLAHHFVARNLGARHLSTCPSAACVSGSQAIALGMDRLLSPLSRTDIVIAGGTDSQISSLGFRARSSILSPDGVSRPFDQQAEGMGMGEGSAIVILAREDYATAHGYPILGYVASYGIDSGDHGAMSLEARNVAQAMKFAFEGAKLSPKDIGAVLAHAPGTKLGDPQEMAGIREALAGAAEEGVPIASANSMTGHLLGASGPLRLVIATQISRTGFFPGNRNLQTVRPGFENLNFPKEGQETDVDAIPINSFGFGGGYITLLYLRFNQ